MEDKTFKIKTIKRLLGLIIPVLVLIITAVMVGISFAWFAAESKVTVQSIKLNTIKMFVLSFNSTPNDSGRNINFKGQHAIDSKGHLRTEYNWQQNGGASGSGYGVNLDQYIVDAPYYFITTIALDTEGCDVDLNFVLDSVKISNGNAVLNLYSSNSGTVHSDAADIPYVFTWYFTEHKEDSSNYTGTISGEDDRRVMKDYLPANDDVWYTPYGKLTFGENGLVKAVGDTAVDDSYSLLDEGLKELRLNAIDTQFDFHIVFAPQKLFWGQFCKADRDKSVNTLYPTEAEREKIFGETSHNMMFYANYAYLGTTFEFSATVNITQLYKNDETD